MVARDARAQVHRGFTLIELLVVIVIIILVSAVALPTVLPALAHREASEAARLLQGALVGARDQAIHDGAPSGVRLLPDPAYGVVYNPRTGLVDSGQILAYNRIVPIGPAPEYSEGMAFVRSGFTYANTALNPSGANVWVPSLILEEAPVYAVNGITVPTSPTSWSWNVRVGDKVQVAQAGPWYTVAGPMWVGPSAGNPEGFVNCGPPGTVSPLNPTGNANVEWLILTNGRDDGPFGLAAGALPGGPDGWVDSGFDGVDNNGVLGVDDAAEWEVESWVGAPAAVPVAYSIRRRPSPLSGARELSLPTSVVIDATSWGTTRERSRLPINPLSGYVDILLNTDGTVVPAPFYGAPSSSGMDQAFFHFWLAERQDLATVDITQTTAPYLPVPAGVMPAGRFAGDARLKGRWTVVTLAARTGLITSSEDPPFLHDSALGYNAQTGTYNASNPFIPAEQGVR